MHIDFKQYNVITWDVLCLNLRKDVFIIQVKQWRIIKNAKIHVTVRRKNKLNKADAN